MCYSVCLLKNVAKFKDAISLMVLKVAANGFNKMLCLCAIPSEEKLNCLWRQRLKNPKNPTSGDMIENPD